MKIIFAFVLSLLVFASLCSATSVAQKDKYAYAVAGIDDADAADKFFLEIKQAVEKNERDKIAALVSYPINVSIKGRRTKLRSKAELLKNYNTVFNETVKQALAKSAAPSFVNYQGVMIGDGEIWFNLVKNKFKIIAINN